MFGIGPLVVFLGAHRFSSKDAKKRERNSVYLTNFILLILVATLSLMIGFKQFILIQLPILWIGTMVGVWMFYIQHQFEGVYWERSKDWDFVRAGLEGSSFYNLPKVLQWFTGNIGFHHIHHLSPKIPNYLLERCYLDNTIFQVKPVNLFSSLKSLSLRLWDEKTRRLVPLRFLKTQQSGI
jgi:omega-6 fatty acid desaturase (delta-12 desaturase)